MVLLSILVGVISFLAVLIITPYWIRRAKEHGLVGKDMHKPGKSIAELGGLCVISGFMLGTLSYVAVEVFVNGNGKFSTYLFATITAILVATIIGLTDDILGWKIGLRQYQKAILTIAIALPIMVVKAGHSTMNLPFVGKFNLGLVYPLLIVPLGIIGASNGFNMIAGFNGLEAGMGIIILSTLGYLSWATGTTWVAVMAFCMVAALLAFMIFNFYPAKVFPGDTLTYSVGALIAAIAIFGNIEKFALILFIPYFIEFFLKTRGFMQKESFGKVMKDGSLERPYDKYYGIEHIVIDILRKIKKKAYEYEVVLVIWAFEIICVMITMLNFLPLKRIF